MSTSNLSYTPRDQISIPIPSSASASPLSMTFPPEASGFAMVPVVSPHLQFQFVYFPKLPWEQRNKRHTEKEMHLLYNRVVR